MTSILTSNLFPGPQAVLCHDACSFVSWPSPLSSTAPGASRHADCAFSAHTCMQNRNKQGPSLSVMWQAASSNSMLHPVTHPFSQPVPSASAAQQQYSSQQLFAQRQRGAMPQHIQGRFRGPCLIPAGHMKEVAYPVQGCNHLVLHSPQSSPGWAFRLLCASAPQGAVQLLVPPYVLAQGCCGRQQSAGVKC